MPIEQLVSVIVPPKKPLDNMGEWEAAAIVVGIDSFPPDYRELIQLYGTGEFFDGYLRVYNAVTVAGLARIRQELERYRIDREENMTLPLDVHPKRPGLLPWGRDENGNGYCWLTRGKPGKWPVVFLGHGWESRPERFSTDVTGFLARYATNSYKSLLPGGEPFAEKDRVFTPGRSQAEVSEAILRKRKAGKT